MCIYLLTRQIEGLRSEMIKVAERQGSLIDPQVIELSQQLDQLLVLMQRLQKVPLQQLTPKEKTDRANVPHRF